MCNWKVFLVIYKKLILFCPLGKLKILWSPLPFIGGKKTTIKYNSKLAYLMEQVKSMIVLMRGNINCGDNQLKFIYQKEKKLHNTRNDWETKSTTLPNRWLVRNLVL